MSKTEYGEQMESYEGQPTYSEKIESTEVIESHNNELTTASGEGGLQRNLQARHLTMISLGGTIGTGLFLASGSSISVAGPGYALIAYGLIGTMVYCFMSSLGEMTTYMPITGSINAYGTRFVDPAFGFMLGKSLVLLSLCLKSQILSQGPCISLGVHIPSPGSIFCSFQGSDLIPNSILLLSCCSNRMGVLVLLVDYPCCRIGCRRLDYLILGPSRKLSGLGLGSCLHCRPHLAQPHHGQGLR